MTSSKIEEAFDLYATTSDPHARQRAFSELVAKKVLPKHDEDPHFVKGLGAWLALLAMPDTRCMVPESRDVIISIKEETALWQTCFMAAPERRREFEPSLPKVERKDQRPGPAV